MPLLSRLSPEYPWIYSIRINVCAFRLVALYGVQHSLNVITGEVTRGAGLARLLYVFLLVRDRYYMSIAQDAGYRLMKRESRSDLFTLYRCCS